MDGNFNKSAFKQLENTLADALKAGKKVDVKIDVIHSGDSLRPDGFVVDYVIDGVPDTKVFFNKPGGSQ